MSDFFRNFSVKNSDFSGFYYVQEYCSVALIPVDKSMCRLTSRGSGRCSGGSRCELSHDLKRNPIFTFISANKGHFAVLWKAQLLTEISSLAQTNLETKYNHPLPTPQFY